MDELIRARIHDALAVEQPPAGLRSRVITAVPMDRSDRRQWRMPTLSGQWAAGFVAILLTAALVAALVYSRIGTQGLTHNAPPASPLRLSSPDGIAVAPDGAIYVSDYTGDRVYKVQQDSTLVTVAGGGSQYEGVATKANLFSPAGLAFAPNGDLYIADNRGSTIRRLDRNGMLSTLVAIHASAGGNSPLGLAFDQAGLLYVGNFTGDVASVTSNGTVARIDLSGIPAPVVNPGFLAFDSEGNLYVADRGPITISPAGQVPASPGGCRIIRVAPDHSASVVAGTGTCGYSGDAGAASRAELNDPGGIAFDSAGNLYFADSNNHRIRRIDTRGIITTIAGSGVEGEGGDGGPAVRAELMYLAGVAIVRDRFLYVSDSCGCSYGAVRMIDLRTGTIRTVVSSNSRVVS